MQHDIQSSYRHVEIPGCIALCFPAQINPTKHIGIARFERWQQALKASAHHRVPIRRGRHPVISGRPQFCPETIHLAPLFLLVAVVVRNRMAQYPVKPCNHPFAASQARSLFQCAEQAILKQIVRLGRISHASREKAMKATPFRNQHAHALRVQRYGGIPILRTGEFP